MAVLSVNERFQERRSEWRAGKLVHTQEWLVICDEKSDGPWLAIVAEDPRGNKIPSTTDSPDYDGAAVMTALTATPHSESAQKFIVQAEFTNSGFGQSITNPLDRPPEITYGGTDATEPYFVDYSDTPKRVVNSAGDPFAHDLERDTGEISFTITVNEATFNTVLVDSFKHTVNQDDVIVDGVTYAPQTLKLGVPTAEKITEKVQTEGTDAWETFTYYQISYPVKANAQTWDVEIIDQGLNELIPSADPTKPAKLKPIMDSSALNTDQPQLLDGTGKKAQPGAGGIIKPTILTFKPYQQTDFSSLKPFMASTWATNTE